jgi:HK97 family phage major capsid protein
MDTEKFETILKDVNDKLAALGQSIAPDALRSMIDKRVAEMVEAQNQKMRFIGTPSERLAGSKYARFHMGVGDVELLHQILSAGRAAGLSSGPSEMLTNALKACSPALYGEPDDAFDGPPRARAMDTAESGYGSQLIGAQYVGELWDAAKAKSKITALLPTFEMTAPTAYLPVRGALPEVLLVSESTANNSSNFTTSKTGSNRVSVSAKKLALHQMWSGDLEEDSIIGFLPFLRAAAEDAVAYYLDSAFLNGDDTNEATGNINLVDANPADSKHYLAFDGLIHAALVDNTNNATSASGAAPSLSAALNLRKLMLDRTYYSDWGHPDKPEDLVYICDPETADALADQEGDLRTVDKYGSAAVVMTGEVAKIGRHPLLSSIAMALANSTGNVPNAGGTVGRMLAFNRGGYNVGWRRRIKVETERIIATDQARIVYTMRVGFGRYTPTGAASGIESAALLYNILV